MKKLFFTLALALAAVFNFSAKAQSEFFYARIVGVNTAATIISTNIGITTSQATTIGGPQNTLTVSPPGGSYTNPSNIFAYGAYWTPVSLFYQLGVTINAGYTATVYNPNSTTLKARIQVGLYNDDITGTVTYHQSAVYSIPGQSSVVIPIPSCTQSYKAITPGATYPGDAYPTLVYLQALDVN